MPLKDSGAKSHFSTGAQRDAGDGKGRFDLIPFEAMQQIARIFEEGGKKYGDRNWEKGFPTHRLADSASRHLAKHINGHRDEPHLAMAGWNIICLLQTQFWIEQGILPPELETLPPRKPKRRKKKP